MNRIVGSKKEEPKPAVQQQVPVKQEVQQQPPIDLTGQTKKLEVRIQEINGNIANVDKELKEMYPKMKAAKGTQQVYYKQRIVNLMKKRKMLQQQVDAFLGQQLTIEKVAFTNETIQNTIETTKALKQAVQVQKETMKNLNIDELEDLRDEMSDMQFESQQINELLSRNYDVDADEDDLDAELKELDDEIYLEELSKGNQKNNTGKISMASSTQSQKQVADPYADILGKINSTN